MYKKIYVPLDNSEHSNSCMDFSMALAKATGARLIGCHVYAAKLHDTRFKQMEFTLPEEYRDETELEKQRRTHDSLISKGLKLISNSYLDVLEERCKQNSLPFEKKTFDGQNFRELVKDIHSSDYDLVIIGAHGQGAVKGSLIGSVAERVTRRILVDTLVIKNVQPWEEQVDGGSSPIVVALDGSSQSFHGLKIGMFLAKQFNKPLRGVAVYDPYLHYSIFHSIADVLSDEASKVFKFKEQEQLHEEVIDTGLAKIYQSHLEIGKRLAKEEGLEMQITLLPGKPFEKILQHVQTQNAWLLICGRIGIHSEPEMDIGSNSENLLRMASCHLLLASGQFVPPIDLKAEESIHWTAEAMSRMERVPDFVRGVARNAVLRWAMERGHSVITSSVIDQAMGDVLPPGADAAMGMAAKLAQQRLTEDAVYICDNCGHTARKQRPEKCVVCGAPGEKFSKLNKEAIESSAKQEGQLEEETTFDGVRLFWSSEARQALQAVPSGYPRRSARARIEKLAKVRKLSKITRELVQEVVRQENREPLKSETSSQMVEKAEQGASDEKRIVQGEFPWTEAALQRLQRVPEGFMRNITRENIIKFVRQQNAEKITLDLAEQGIAFGRKMITEGFLQPSSDPKTTVENPKDVQKKSMKKN